MFNDLTHLKLAKYSGSIASKIAKSGGGISALSLQLCDLRQEASNIELP